MISPINIVSVVFDWSLSFSLAVCVLPLAQFLNAFNVFILRKTCWRRCMPPISSFIFCAIWCYCWSNNIEKLDSHEKPLHVKMIINSNHIVIVCSVLNMKIVYFIMNTVIVIYPYRNYKLWSWKILRDTNNLFLARARSFDYIIRYWILWHLGMRMVKGWRIKPANVTIMPR